MSYLMAFDYRDRGRWRSALVRVDQVRVDPVRVGGVRYTIKDGIVYDAPKLLAAVRKMVEEAKKKEGFRITQPGEGK